jgi:general secretion pathway protein E
MFGESVVLRLLDRGGRPVQLDALGMPADILATVTALATRPHGMVLVTGPTGSGKTTTLYAALQRRETAREKIITVEDPVEYQLTGVTQVPVHRQAGVTFGSALRSILRQDPDVVMIGEMRDPETAEIGVQAAMTGHLVFSTLHTNDALGAIPRLFDLGVAPYLVAGTLDGVLAQRLVRVICEHCRTLTAPTVEQLHVARRWDIELPDRLAHGVGCSHCRGTGFQGRLGVFELLFVDEPVREHIVSYTSRTAMAEAARRAGMRSMLDDGWRKVQDGLTTIDEVLRVVQPQ